MLNVIRGRVSVATENKIIYLFIIRFQVQFYIISIYLVERLNRFRAT